MSTQDEREWPFKQGESVQIKLSVLPRLLVKVSKRLMGKVGIVQRCYIPLGAREWSVRVQWLRANRISTMGQPEHWRAQDLESPSPTKHKEEANG